MSNQPQIKLCPNCGNEKIKLVVRDVTRKYKKQTYTVPAVSFYDCPNCGEKVYDHEAMLKIQPYSPAYQMQNTALNYENPTAPVAEGDWNVLQ